MACPIEKTGKVSQPFSPPPPGYKRPKAGEFPLLPPQRIAMTHERLEKEIRRKFDCDKDVGPLGGAVLLGLIANYLGKNPQDLYSLSGISLLDLACGSAAKPHESSSSRNSEPWALRCLQHIGGKAVGVDIRSNDNEGFESHCRDLTKKGALDFLQSGSFDAIIFDRTVALEPYGKATSPHILRGVVKVGDKMFLASPDSHSLFACICCQAANTSEIGEKYAALALEVVSQSQRLLKEGGILRFHGCTFRKKDGELHFLK